MWKPTQYAPDVLAAYREAQAAHPSVRSTFCHATYLINLASPDPDALPALRRVPDLQPLGVAGHGRVGRRAARRQPHGRRLRRRAGPDRRRRCRARSTRPTTRPTASTARSSSRTRRGPAGRSAATSTRSRRSIDACGGDERLGICIDTQHLWASGVDYSTVAGAEAVRRRDRPARRARAAALPAPQRLQDRARRQPGPPRQHRRGHDRRGRAGPAGRPPPSPRPAALLEVPGDGDGPRADDVVAAQHVVARGAALYGATVEIPPPPPPPAKKAVEEGRQEGDQEGWPRRWPRR